MNVKKNVLKKKAKSFYFASIFLSKDCFTNCSQLYNFCRIVDDIADNNYKNKKFLLKNIYNSITNPDSFESKYLPLKITFFCTITFSLNVTNLTIISGIFLLYLDWFISEPSIINAS